MKSKNMLSTVLTPVLIMTIMNVVASAYDGCSAEFDAGTTGCTYGCGTTPLNGDVEITAIALELAAGGEWDPAADVNCDERVTSLDALIILQAAAGNIELEGGES